MEAAHFSEKPGPHQSTQIHSSIFNLTALFCFLLQKRESELEFSKFGSIANIGVSFNTWFILQVTGLLRLMEIMRIIIITGFPIGLSVFKIYFSSVYTVDCYSAGMYKGKHLTFGSDVTRESTALASTCFQLLRFAAPGYRFFAEIQKFVLKCFADRQLRVNVC
jgi:hypothetical protein